MAKKIISQKVKSEVSAKTFVTVVTVAVLIALSLIIATLAPNSGLGNFFAASVDLNITSIAIPACLYNPTDESNWSSVPNPSGKYVFLSGFASTTANLLTCQQQPNWRAFCSFTPSTIEGCSYNAPGVIFSPEIKSVIGLNNVVDPSTRNAVFARLNDGINDEPDHTNLKEYNLQAMALYCPVCPLISMDSAVQTPVSTININNAPVKIYSGEGIMGQKDLLLKWGILSNRLAKYNTAINQCESALPAGCGVSQSFVDGSCDEHGQGRGIDISCGDSATLPGSNCSGKTKLALDKIIANNPGFDIIGECSGTTLTNSAYQTIHLHLNNSQSPILAQTTSAVNNCPIQTCPEDKGWQKCGNYCCKPKIYADCVGWAYPYCNPKPSSCKKPTPQVCPNISQSGDDRSCCPAADDGWSCGSSKIWGSKIAICIPPRSPDGSCPINTTECKATDLDGKKVCCPNANMECAPMDLSSKVPLCQPKDALSCPSGTTLCQSKKQSSDGRYLQRCCPTGTCAQNSDDNGTPYCQAI